MKVEFFNTPMVEGRSILEYKGFVNVSQVAGTGFISDFVAGLSDIFGGNSGVYRNAMNDLCDNILEQLNQIAENRGANAIINLHIDYDNISGKGTSMFMISAQGTAVLLSEKIEKKQNEIGDTAIVNQKDLEKKILTKKILKVLEHDCPYPKDWTSIISFADEELAPSLHNKFIRLNSGIKAEINLERDTFNENYIKYFSRLPQTIQKNLAYQDESTPSLIQKFSLFDADHLLEKAKENKIEFVIKCLPYTKAIYTKHDVVKMEQLYEILTNLPDQGHYEEVKGGLFSSSGKKFICTCGEKNDIESKHCANCGRSIKGLTREQEGLIEQFKIKIDTLKEIFASQLAE